MISSLLKWIPTEWDRQAISAAFWLHILTLGGMFLSWLIMSILLLSKYWWIGILYMAWILIDETPHRGGRMFRSLKKQNFFASSSKYYPVQLIKTVDLDPSKNYIFANFPHGLFCAGVLMSFLTDVLKFNELFPGITSRVMMHHYFFYIPFLREVLLALSAIPSSEKSMKYLLDEEKFKGNCIIGVIGGAREALESEPGKHRLILNKRKGFIRVAIQTGASIVPVYSFGELEVFGKTSFEKNSFLYRYQHWLMDYTGLMLVKISGKGFFGLVPFRNPVNVVVGEPVEVKKNPNPSADEINFVHVQFKLKLIQLFEAEKAKYIENHEDTHLEFVPFD